MEVNYIIIGVVVALLWNRITGGKNEPTALLTAMLFWPTVIVLGVIHVIMWACYFVNMDYIIRERKGY